MQPIEYLRQSMTIGEHLEKYLQIVSNGNRAQSLPEGYHRPIHESWAQMDEGAQAGFILSLEPNEGAEFLKMMLGEPSHSSQPRNKKTKIIFNQVLDLSPGTFIHLEKNNLPSWISIVPRFNIHEDESYDEVVKNMKKLFYCSELDQRWWPFHKRLATQKKDLRK
jgi:hypothetical protein